MTNLNEQRRIAAEAEKCEGFGDEDFHVRTDRRGFIDHLHRYADGRCELCHHEEDCSRCRR